MRDRVGAYAADLVGAGCRPWLDEALGCARNAGADPQAFYDRHASAARALRQAPPHPCAAGRDLLGIGGVRDADHWNTVDLVRAALILEALERLPEDAHAALLRRLYQKGDIAEQRLVLRALVLCPQPQQFLALALEGCRSNVRGVFEAIACDNDYPRRHFPDANFHQLVLKALFIEVPVGRIAGLAERRSAELTRMVAAYADERRAAARSVSDDVQSLLAGAAHAPSSSTQ